MKNFLIQLLSLTPFSKNEEVIKKDQPLTVIKNDSNQTDCPYQKIINSLNHAIKTDQLSLRIEVGTQEFSDPKKFCLFYYGLKQNNPALKFGIYGGFSTGEHLMFDLKSYNGPRDQEIKLIFEDARLTPSEQVRIVVPPPHPTYFQKRQATYPQSKSRIKKVPKVVHQEGNLMSFDFGNPNHNSTRRFQEPSENNVVDLQSYKSKRSR